MKIPYIVVFLSKNADFSIGFNSTACKLNTTKVLLKPHPTSLLKNMSKFRLMKKQYQLLLFSLLFHAAALLPGNAKAQCTNAQINWDYLDYLHRSTTAYSNYITAGMYPSMVQTQSFAIGVNRLTISHNYVTANNIGENTTHTGEAGSRGTGADVEFRGNGIITCTFDNAVTNTSFSLYDIDRNQVVAVTAFNGATPVNITMASVSGTTLTVVGSGGTTPVATANNTTVANNATNASLNIDIAASITSFVITVTATGTCSGGSCGSGGTENGAFWLSDITACVTGSFPTNYYTVSEPFTGQPAYVLAVHDQNTIYMVDPATGRAVSLFTDATARVLEINDLAYDPYKRILYYSVDGLERCTPAGAPDSVRYIRKYDFNTEQISQVIDNVNNAPFNIPTFYYGLESASSAFYNGSLYQGVEGTQSGSTNTGREGIVWRIDFAADSITPIKACQVFALPVDNGSSLLHDWGDIIIKDGILYDFNAAAASSVGNYNLLNLQTKTMTTHNGVRTSDKPRQAGQQWDGTLLWLHDSVTTYNGTNVLTLPKRKIVAAPRSVTWVLGAGDAAEAFRPKADFGDAPSTYDPDPKSPALNERDTAIRIGTTYDWEWNKNTSTDATGDGSDEDGLAYVPIFARMINQYVVQVQVWNNSGANATLCAWFDYNGNGVFDVSEGLAPITVSSMASYQSFYLSWTGISSPLNNGDYTYLRIRITSAANSMTASNPTGYFNDGETEDYRVLVDDFPLSVNMLSFQAKALNNAISRLNWSTASEENFSGFGVERSADGVSWSTIGFVNSKGNNRSGNNDYVFDDLQPLKGKSYYRLKLTDINSIFRYSEVRQIFIKDALEQVLLIPNPASSNTSVFVNSNVNAEALIILQDMQGRRLRTEKYRLSTGNNSIQLNNLSQLSNGTYIVQVITGQQSIGKKLLINK